MLICPEVFKIKARSQLSKNCSASTAGGLAFLQPCPLPITACTSTATQHSASFDPVLNTELSHFCKVLLKYMSTQKEKSGGQPWQWACSWGHPTLGLLLYGLAQPQLIQKSALPLYRAKIMHGQHGKHKYKDHRSPNHSRFCRRSHLKLFPGATQTI